MSQISESDVPATNRVIVRLGGTDNNACHRICQLLLTLLRSCDGIKKLIESYLRRYFVLTLLNAENLIALQQVGQRLLEHGNCHTDLFGSSRNRVDGK